MAQKVTHKSIFFTNGNSISMRPCTNINGSQHNWINHHISLNCSVEIVLRIYVYSVFVIVSILLRSMRSYYALTVCAQQPDMLMMIVNSWLSPDINNVYEAAYVMAYVDENNQWTVEWKQPIQVIIYPLHLLISTYWVDQGFLSW